MSSESPHPLPTIEWHFMDEHPLRDTLQEFSTAPTAIVSGACAGEEHRPDRDPCHGG